MWLLVVSLLGLVSAFQPVSVLKPVQKSSSTALGISFGFEPDERGIKATKDPFGDLKTRLRRKSVYVRELGGTVVVSGAIRNTGADLDVFDMLVDADTGFVFDKILALTQDKKLARKRLLSREARYSGLWDELGLLEGESPLLTANQVKEHNISTWVAIVDDNHLDTLEDILQVCQECDEQHKGTLRTVGILLVNAFDLDEERCADLQERFMSLSDGMRDPAWGETVEERLRSQPIEHTIVAVGELQDYPEAQYTYEMKDFGELTLAPDAKMSRAMAARFITDMILLDESSARGFTIAEIRDDDLSIPEVKFIRAMRAMGFGHQEEIVEMIKGEAETYVPRPDKDGKVEKNIPTEGHYWWESKSFWELDRETRKAKMERNIKKELKKTDRQLGVEEAARAWIDREFYKRYKDGVLNGMGKKEFSQYIMPRAIKEGDRRYRMYWGEIPMENGEFYVCPEKIEAKKDAVLEQRMLERFKQLLIEEGEYRGDDEDIDTDDYPEEYKEELRKEMEEQTPAWMLR